MKSFADWTDEIRALMNPPKPMVDTCNLAGLEDYEVGTFKPTLSFDTADGTDSTAEHFYTRIGDTVTVGAKVKLEGRLVWPEAVDLEDLRFYDSAKADWGRTGKVVVESKEETRKRATPDMVQSFLEHYGNEEGLMPWQKEMLERLRGGQWPDTVGLGSGRRCGKTMLRNILMEQTMDKFRAMYECNPFNFNKIEPKE